MVGSLLARQQMYLHNLAEKRRLEKEKEEAEQAAAKQLMLKVPLPPARWWPCGCAAVAAVAGV